MNFKKIIKNILILIFVLFPWLAFSAVDTWNLNTDTNYTLSNTTTTEVSDWVWKLKMLIEHHWTITNGWATRLNNPEGIVVDWNYAYVASATSDAIEIIDISDPANPTHHSSIQNWAWWAQLDDPRALVKNWNYLYVAVSRSDDLEVIDVSNPASPTHVTNISDWWTIYLNWARGIDIQWNYLYVTSYQDDALSIFDISTAWNPTFIWSIRAAWWRLDWAQWVKVVWNYAYVTSDRNDSFQVIDISNKSNPTFAWQLTDWAWWALLDWPRDVEISWNYAYVVSTVSDSLEIIDISVATNPTHATSIADWWTLELNWARAIDIDWNYAYIAAHDDDWVQIIDISIATSPIQVNQITDGWTMELNWATTLQKVWYYIYIWSRVDDWVEILKVSYDNSSPYIVPNDELVYSWSIDKITTTYWAWNEWTVTYQISKDNWVTWYYLNWSNRTTTTSWVIHSNTPSEINYEIQTFNGLAGWTWEFKWKAFLTSNGSQKVELDTVTIDSTSQWTNEIIDFEAPWWYTVSQGTWLRQSTDIYEWSFSIEADNWWANNSTSCFDIDKTIYNDSTISFYKSVDSEANYDFLRFYIDWVQQEQRSWNIWWSQETYDVWNWNHTFRWCYEKDWSQNDWADTAWVDYIEIVEKPITPPPVISKIIDFETASGYTVTQGIWNRQTSTVYEWSYSAEADNQWVHNSQSCFEVTDNIANDFTISFFKSVSSEATYDFLRFYVDDWLTWQWSWTVWWSEETYNITAWAHTFKWCYEKDASVSNWSDTAWVDYIVIAEDPNPPVEIPVLDFEVTGWYTVTTAETSPGPDWIRQTSEKFEWSYAIESQNNWIANSSSCFERVQTVTAADTWISFYKKVNSIAAWPDWDHLIFYIDWVEQTRWSWSSGRSREIYNLSPNTYTLRWCYVKNWSWDDPIDKAWIDFVSVTQDSPILTEVTPVTTPTNDNTPSYTFNSPIAWDIIYGWSCSSTTDKATIWNNTVTFNSLVDGIYTDCTIQVQGTPSNSTVLSVSNFTIDTTRITNTINYPVDTSTIPNKSFTFDVSYSDDNWVDTWSIILTLHKFDDWLGLYGTDIAWSYVDFPWATIWGTWATYPVSQLWHGQYKIIFTIADTLWNDSTSTTEFTIDQEPLELVTTINNSWGWTFSYEFTVENITSDNITDWIIWFQLDNWTITTSSWWTFTNNWNLFEVRSDSPTTTTFTPWQTHTISFSWNWNWIVTDLYLIWYTNASPEIPQDYNDLENWLEAIITTTSINWNEYCRNVALTNTWTEDITNWQIQFDLDWTVHTTSNWLFSQNWIIHTIDPDWNADISIWSTENITFCTTWLKADNNWNITLVTLSVWDIIAPTISSYSPFDDEIKTTGIFDFVFNYSDNIWWDWIDINSDEITLHKWDWAIYGPDIAPTNMFLWSKTVTSSSATYPSNNIVDWQYKVIFKIYDLNNNFVSQSTIFNVWIPPSDTTPPTITNNFPNNNILYPNDNFDISINYLDTESWIDTWTISMNIKKRNWSSWWADISWTYITWTNINSTGATYNCSKLWYWKYKIYFYIEDNDSNSNFSETIFYIDEPELIVSTWSLNIWKLQEWINNFSPEFNIMVKTVWAWYNLLLNTENLLEQHSSIQIVDWTWIEWFWYDKNPYTSTINLINTNEIIATEAKNININWEKNTYTYYLKLWTNITEQQAAWSYSWSIKIWLDLDY